MDNNNIKIDISTPRQAVYQTLAGGPPGPCPECGGALHNSAKPYMAATRKSGQLADGVFVGGDFGWFCLSCPVLVIDENKLKDLMGRNQSEGNVGSEFLLMGILDFDSLPEDKRQLTLEALGDDLPLVMFSNLSDEKERKKKKRRHRHKKKR